MLVLVCLVFLGFAFVVFIGGYAWLFGLLI